MKYLPKDDPYYPAVRKGYEKMMAGLLKHQRADGLWGQLVDDAGSWTETSGSAMFAFGFVTGVKLGILDRSPYTVFADNRTNLVAAFMIRTEDGISRAVTVYGETDYEQLFWCERPGETAIYAKVDPKNPFGKYSFDVPKDGRYYFMIRAKENELTGTGRGKLGNPTADSVLAAAARRLRAWCSRTRRARSSRNAASSEVCDESPCRRLRGVGRALPFRAEK